MRRKRRSKRSDRASPRRRADGATRAGRGGCARRSRAVAASSRRPAICSRACRTSMRLANPPKQTSVRAAMDDDARRDAGHVHARRRAPDVRLRRARAPRTARRLRALRRARRPRRGAVEERRAATCARTYTAARGRARGVSARLRRLRTLRRLPVAARRRRRRSARAKRAIVAEQLARLGGLRDVDVAPTLAAGTDWRYRAPHHAGRRGPAPRLPPRALARARRDRRLPDRRPGGRRAPRRRRAPGLARAARRADARRRSPRRRAASCWSPRRRRAPGRARRRRDRGSSSRASRDGARRRARAAAAARLVVGDPTVRVELEPGLALEVPADVFTQVNPAANRLPRRHRARARRASAPGARVLDLYCGAGNFALPLARRGAARARRRARRRLAVDAGRAERRAPRARRRRFHARRRSPTRSPHVAAGRVDARRARPAARGRRRGDRRARRRSRAPRVVYVSCDPATLARDAARARRARLSGRARAAGRPLPADVSRRNGGGIRS